jgi:hypothetical protein
MKAKVLHLVVPLLLLFAPAAVLAQEHDTSSTFADLQQRQILERDDKILVTFDYEGTGEYERVEARFLRLSDTTLVIRVRELPQGRSTLRIERHDDRRTIEIPEGRVAEIRLPKSGMPRWAGGLIGGAAGVGGTVGLMFACYETCDEGAFTAGALAMVGGGATMGALLASPQPERAVYSRAALPASRLAWAVAPIVTRNQKGALFSVVW